MAKARFRETVEFVDKTITSIDKTFRELAPFVEEPVATQGTKSHRYEHSNKTLELACYLKLARIMSALHAIRTLLPKGFFQECGVLLRTVIDFSDEVAFLACKPPGSDASIKKFLEDFFQEIDNTNLGWKAIKRDIVSRRKIHAAIGRLHQVVGTGNSHQIQEAGYAISDVFSMFVHGAYPPIMEMFETPKTIQVNGLRDVYSHSLWLDQMIVTLPRALQAVAHVSRLLRATAVEVDALENLRHFDDVSSAYFLIP